MYITSRQGDRLRNLVMGFEIPFRSFVANKILMSYTTFQDFEDAIVQVNNQLTIAESQLIKSKTGMWAKDTRITKKLYEILLSVHESYVKGDVDAEVKVPDLADIVVLTYIFKEKFEDLDIFESYMRYWELAERYHYIRNKLDHPGSVNIEENDMFAAVSFILDVMNRIYAIDRKLFWLKSYEDMKKEAVSLQTGKIQIPIKYCNLDEMPFMEKSIVCRERELSDLKEYVYGIPGALKKKGSLCVFGYGGVGKTALVLELIKELIADVENGTTLNGYVPDIILFYSAKDRVLNLSRTTGKVEEGQVKKNFSSFDELRTQIFADLGISSFENYHKSGLIVIDNLETLVEEERNKVKDFVQYMSPSEIQYIITSRNEECYEERYLVEGFESESGIQFIQNYIQENNLDIQLNENEMNSILEASRGNTLVLVLCLKRLSQRMATVCGIVADFSKMATINKIENEIGSLPNNGFEIVSEYMFKNTFDEIEEVYQRESAIMYSVLKIFAVWPDDDIDIYTVALLLNKDYARIEPIILILCKYLILEKIGDAYSLNRFAAKYIIERFLPDSEEYIRLSNEIQKSINDNRRELKRLEDDMNNKQVVHNIFDDWCVVTDGDKIAVAKAYKIYQDVQYNCSKETKFFVQSALETAIDEIAILEKTTMHPYVKFQKARILYMISQSRVLENRFADDIIKAYRETIWVIKTNDLYCRIRTTKSFASILWMLGMQLSESEETERESIRYLEESCIVFEKIGLEDKEYFQCLTKLGGEYLKFFQSNMGENYKYLDKAKEVSDILYEKRYYYQSERTIKYHATELRKKILPYYS